jgi:hypothetical protein
MSKVNKIIGYGFQQPSFPSTTSHTKERFGSFIMKKYYIAESVSFRLVRKRKEYDKQS